MPPTIIEKTPSTSPDAKAPPPTPLQICNAKIVEAKRDAREEGERRRRAWLTHKNSPPSVPFNFNAAMAATVEMEHVNGGHRLHSLSRNFSPQTFESNVLDVPQNAILLREALDYLKNEHSEALKSRATRPAPAPKKNGLVTLIENALGSPIEPEPTFAPPRPPPVGGLFGAPETLDVSKELARLSVEIERFPLGQNFSQIVGALNAVASALHEQEPPPPAPKRMDKGFVPLHG